MRVTWRVFLERLCHETVLIGYDIDVDARPQASLGPNTTLHLARIILTGMIYSHWDSTPRSRTCERPKSLAVLSPTLVRHG